MDAMVHDSSVMAGEIRFFAQGLAIDAIMRNIGTIEPRQELNPLTPAIARLRRRHAH